MKKALSLFAMLSCMCIQSYADGIGPYHKQIHPAKTPDIHTTAPKPNVKKSDTKNDKRASNDINNPEPAPEPLEGSDGFPSEEALLVAPL